MAVHKIWREIKTIFYKVDMTISNSPNNLQNPALFLCKENRSNLFQFQPTELKQKLSEFSLVIYC